MITRNQRLINRQALALQRALARSSAVVTVPVSPTVTMTTYILSSKLSDQEVKLFFEDKTQMKCTVDQAKALIDEGIVIPEDLVDFEDDDIDNVVANLRKLTPPVRLSALCVKRLKIAAEGVRYYKNLGRDLSATGMQYVVLDVFWKQFQSLKAQKKSSAEAKFPKMDRHVSMLRWTELALNALNSRIGGRYAPLSYVIRKDEAVPSVAHVLAANLPWCEEYGSVKEELINRLSFMDPVFNDDMAALYDLLVEALHGTQYAATLISFKKKKNGRAAWFALLRQHAGTDKWEQELKREQEVLTSHSWKGNNNITLSKFTDKHRSSYINMVTCAYHVEFQLPNERTRVKYLTDAIKCPDAGIQARLASISGDDRPGIGMRNNFESAVQHLLPACPVEARNKNRDNTSSARGTTVSAVQIKCGKGGTGVDLRWHPNKEFNNLRPDQKAELSTWRLSAEGMAASAAEKAARDANKSNNNKKQRSVASDGGGKGKKQKLAFKKMISSVVGEAVKSHSDKNAESAQIGALAANLVSILETQSSSANTSKGTATASSLVAASGAPTQQQVVQRLASLLNTAKKD
jgi:hypothetical protein